MRVGFRLRTAFVCLAWLATTAVALRHQVPRLLNAINSPGGMFGWFFSMDADWSLPVLVLLTLPVIALVLKLAGSNLAAGQPARSGGRGWTERSERSPGVSGHCRPTPAVRTQVGAATALFCLSLCCSAWIGFRSVSITAIPGQLETKSSVRFHELPPAYHDEFSYLLQARTFLAGRLSWPAMTVQSDLFHQVHVLNRPTTASRYFPWTGVWMAPFVGLSQFKTGVPYFGHWLAGAIACVFFHRCLYRLLELRWAFIVGALVAVSPGLASFSNLLLAHHPTMMALSVFLWAFLRLMENHRVTDAMIAGTALSLAMLGRPMTAAGFALPFGIWLLAALIRQQFAGRKLGTTFTPATWSPMKIVAGIGIPILLGFGVLTIMNHAITGSCLKSAYQLYTDTWTPRHRYGFDNANINPALPESKVLKAYDDWAENLTLAKAKTNVGQRIVYSLRWTLGIAALMFGIIAGLAICLDIKDPRPLLLLCSVLTLHAVHLPYWYDGIMHWHYVFETAPLLIMLATLGLNVTYQILRSYVGTRWTTLWLVSLIFASLIPNWIDAEMFWGTSRVTVAFREQVFSRVRFEYFRRLTTSDQIQHPALVLVDEGTSNPQLSYIINPPDLSGDVIVCRLPESPSAIDELANAFPGHHLYRFNPETFELAGL